MTKHLPSIKTPDQLFGGNAAAVVPVTHWLPEMLSPRRHFSLPPARQNVVPTVAGTVLRWF